MSIEFLGKESFYYFKYDEEEYYTVDGCRFYCKSTKSKVVDAELILLLTKAYDYYV